MFCVTPTAKCEVRCANIVGNQRVARIEFRRSFIFSKRPVPFAAAAVNRTSVSITNRVTRLKFNGLTEFLERGIIVTIASIIKEPERQVCIW